MSLRPPTTPRQPSSLPRRKSISQPPGSSSLLFPRAADELDSLSEAMRKNNPARYDSPDPYSSSAGRGSSDSPSPVIGLHGGMGASPVEERKRALRRPSMMNLRASMAKSVSRPGTPSSSSTPKTPQFPPRSKTPTGFGSSISSRVAPATPKRAPPPPKVAKLGVGDAVTLEVGGVAMEGTVRFLGEVEGKEGNWGGVELDEAWAGKGKNDGSVKGAQYFACPPLCGLFLPLSKITLKPMMPPPPRPSASTDAASRITAGSRASKYLGMTAKELASKRLAASTSSPSKSTPKRAASPEKLALGNSVPASPSTPRPARAPRTTTGTPSYATPRKSIGTPRASLGGALKRPPSSLRTHDIPPVPTAFQGSRSMTPSFVSGRGTPSTSGRGTPSISGRRMSIATDSSLVSRPATPSMRSLSRQSFASSLSRQSHQSYDEEGEDLRKALEEAREAREKEGEVRRLLEGSERVGREMEDRLGEKEHELREVREKLAGLEREKEREREREKERELVRAAGIGDEEGARELDQSRLRELEERVEELVGSEASVKAAAEKQAREWENKFAARQSELESLKDRMAQATKEADEERLDLNSQIDKLRGAGQALCETYEDRIAEIEDRRLESVELVDSLSAQLARLQASCPSTPPSPSMHLKSSHSSAHTSAADVIDAENALADLEHMRKQMATLEEQLEETRMHLDSEVTDARRRRQKSGEVEMALKKEVKTLRDAIERSTQAESRAAARIEELEEALIESQTALENERSEVEGLRHDASGTASNELADEIKRANKQLSTLKVERQASLRELEDARREATRNAELVTELREDLRAAEKEIDKCHRSPARTGSIVSDSGSPSSSPVEPRSDRLSVLRLNTSTPVQQTSQDIPSAFSSPTTQRDSATSLSNRRSASGKDELTAMREQIVGLKVIITTLTEENQQMVDRNKSLMSDSQELRDAQRSLEATVENLMAEMASGSNVPGAANNKTQLLGAVPLQREVDDLKTKLKEAEKRSEREIKALNQEVTELESLIESKIYREDELESELEKYKRLAAKAPAASSKTNGATSVAEDVCDMCGETGHDLDSCPIFGNLAASPTKGKKSPVTIPPSGADFCDDCEEYGHSLEDCPLANEIF